MKFSAIIALAMATIAFASPAAVSLKRSAKAVDTTDGATILSPCIECPCDGWTGPCTCVPNGCCCT